MPPARSGLQIPVLFAATLHGEPVQALVLGQVPAPQFASTEQPAPAAGPPTQILGLQVPVVLHGEPVPVQPPKLQVPVVLHGEVVQGAPPALQTPTLQVPQVPTGPLS